MVRWIRFLNESFVTTRQLPDPPPPYSNLFLPASPLCRGTIVRLHQLNCPMRYKDAATHRGWVSVVSHMCRNFAAARQSLASSFNQRPRLKGEVHPALNISKPVTRHHCADGDSGGSLTEGKSHTHCRLSGSLQCSNTQTHNNSRKKMSCGVVQGSVGAVGPIWLKKGDVNTVFLDKKNRDTAA